MEQMHTLDMVTQLSHEKRALQILQMPQVQRQIKLTEEMYRNNWLGKTPDGAARLEGAAARFALFSVQLALLNDPARPQILWMNTPRHDWPGVQWPGANWGLDNPDNFYRYMIVDSESRYEISGQRRGPGPVQVTFLLYDAIPGTEKQNLEGALVVASLGTQDIHYEPDGSFLITVGPEPATTGTNHLQSAPKARMIVVRDTLGDWSKEFPNQLRVRRVSGPDAPPLKTDTELAEKTANYLKLETAYWLKWFQDNSYENPPNIVPPLTGRAGRWGQLTTNWFKLKDDEALVLTLHPLSAAYLEVQIADPWTVTPNYVTQTAGLTNFQSNPNNDGTYTFVISPKDPGVWNWVDTDDMHLGTFTLRWQEFADLEGSIEGAIRTTEVIKIADLKKMLPAETKWVTADKRRQQISERAETYELRFAN